jgi:hypothetical protein
MKHGDDKDRLVERMQEMKNKYNDLVRSKAEL